MCCTAANLDFFRTAIHEPCWISSFREDSFRRGRLILSARGEIPNFTKEIPDRLTQPILAWLPRLGLPCISKWCHFPNMYV